jgi:hypothetical protein
MLVVAFVVGTLAALVLGFGFPTALLGGVAGVAIAIVAPIPFGLRSIRTGRAAVPVDLAAPVPTSLDQATYEHLPLAVRNAVIARAIAVATGRSPDQIARLLPAMMGRERLSNEATLTASSNVVADLDPTLVNQQLYGTILRGELALAARAAMPPNDRARAIAERNLGRAITEEVQQMALRMSRLVRLDVTIGQLMDAAIRGEVDLAFVVGSVRKVGEHHAEGLRHLG